MRWSIRMTDLPEDNSSRVKVTSSFVSKPASANTSNACLLWDKSKVPSMIDFSFPFEI